MRPLLQKRVFHLQFRIYFFVTFNSIVKGFNCKRYAFVIRFLRVLRSCKKKKTIEVFLSISLKWLNDALFGKKSPQGLGPGAWAWPVAQCSSLTETCMFILSVNWNPGTAARAHRAHGFYLTNRPNFPWFILLQTIEMTS